jgi:hypothetical protein
LTAAGSDEVVDAETSKRRRGDPTLSLAGRAFHTSAALTSRILLTARWEDQWLQRGASTSTPSQVVFPLGWRWGVFASRPAMALMEKD